MLLTATSVTTEVSEEWMEIDTLDTVESGMEITGGSPPAVSDISVDPDVLQTAISVTTQVSEKWMMIDSLDAVESGMEMAGGSPPAEVDISVGPDVLLTAISVRTVVTEKWMDRFVMDRFVMDLVECPSVSRTSAVARTFRPAVSEEYSPVVFAGGEVADAYSLVVVKSDTARVSVLPVAGCKFPAVFWGKVAFDVVGLGVGPPCLRVDSEETFLILIDERAQLARAAPIITLADSSEEGAPVRELIQLSVLGEPLVDNLQEPMPAEATVLIWEPLAQMRYVVTDDVDFDSFGMAPWDAGGMHGNDCQRRETFRTMMLQWLMRLLCRQAIMNRFNGTMRMNTEYGLDRSLMTNTDSPRLAVTPGEWYASDTIRVIRTDLRQMNGFTEMKGAMCDYTTAEVLPR